MIAEPLPLAQQIAAVVDNDPQLPEATAVPCQSWQTAGAANTAAHYGDVIAYPAATLAVSCSQNAHASYTCSDDSNSTAQNSTSASTTAHGTVNVDNFWSTSAVDSATGKPLATLMLLGQVQDLAGQVMPLGKTQTYTRAKLAVISHLAHVHLYLRAVSQGRLDSVESN